MIQLTLVKHANRAHPDHQAGIDRGIHMRNGKHGAESRFGNCGQRLGAVLAADTSQRLQHRRQETDAKHFAGRERRQSAIVEKFLSGWGFRGRFQVAAAANEPNSGG